MAVFGTDMCCEHGLDGTNEHCPAIGFGLMDKPGPHSVGSDCNRAENWLMRPHDDLMTPETEPIDDFDRMEFLVPGQLSQGAK